MPVTFLLSKHLAEDLGTIRPLEAPLCTILGECEVKHGVRVSRRKSLYRRTWGIRKCRRIPAGSVESSAPTSAERRSLAKAGLSLPR